MAITIVTRAGKGTPLNATEHDANLTNLAAAIENTSTGHDHDGTDSKKIPASNITNTPAGNIAATTVQAAVNELDSEKVAKTDIFRYTEAITLNGQDGLTVTHNRGNTTYVVLVTPTNTASLGRVGDIAVVKASNTVVIYNSGQSGIAADCEVFNKT